MTRTPARRPRDAATLVLHRKTKGKLHVLMGCRHSKHAFMPNRYVFPGGAVDMGDRYVKPAAELQPGVARNLAKSCTPSRARALAAAAIRETWEETGLFLARPAPRPAGRIGPGWRPFHDAGLAPALDTLDYVCRAVTPPGRPRRFNARFFVAPADAALGELSGNGELGDLQWIPVEAALTLDVPDITAYVLDQLSGWLQDAAPRQRIPVFRRAGTAFALTHE